MRLESAKIPKRLSLIVFFFVSLASISAPIYAQGDTRFQTTAEFGYIRKEYQSQYFTVNLESGNSYKFALERANVSQKPVNINLSEQQLGEPFLEVKKPDRSILLSNRLMQPGLSDPDCFDYLNFGLAIGDCSPVTIQVDQSGLHIIKVDGYLNDFGGFKLSVTDSQDRFLSISPFEQVPKIEGLEHRQLPGFDPDVHLWRLKNEESLTLTNPIDIWTFTAKANDFVQIQLELISPFPDGRNDLVAGKLFLFDQDFNLLVSDEGFVPFGNARILSELPNTGTYYIGVTTIGEYDSNTWGQDAISGLEGGIANYELDTEIKVLPFKTSDVANSKPRAVKVNAIIITNDVTLECDCWTRRDGSDERPIPSEEVLRQWLTGVNQEFFTLVDSDHWDGFELAKISVFYSPEYVETKRTDSILYDFSNLPVAQTDHLNIVFARLSDFTNITGSTFLNGVLASKNGATLVLDSYQSPETVLIHELGHVIGIKHLAGVFPPEVMELELFDQSVLGYTGLDHSNSEKSFMSIYNSIAYEDGYFNKSRYLTEQDFTLKTPTYGRLFSSALQSWLIKNEIVEKGSFSVDKENALVSGSNLTANVSTSQTEGVTTSRIWESVIELSPSTSAFEDDFFPALAIKLVPEKGLTSAAIWEDSNGGVRLSTKGETGVWQPAKRFDVEGGILGGRQIKIDGNGRAIALWEPLEGRGIEVSHHNGKNWEDKLTLSLSDSGINYRADMDMNSSGQAAVVWLNREEAGSIGAPGQAGRVLVSTREEDGGWSVAFTLHDEDVVVEDPSIALNDRGDILIAWQELNDEDVFVIKGKFWNASKKDWGVEELYSDQSQELHSGFAEVALDNNGNGVITWREADRTAGEQLAPKGNIMARYRGFDGNLQSVVKVSIEGHDSYNRAWEFDRQTLGFLLDGSAVTTWYAFDGTDFRVYVATMSSQGVWSTPIPLSDGQQHAKLPSLSVNSGDASSVSVAWVRSNGIHKVVQFSERGSLDTAWSQPIDLSSTTQTAFWPDVKGDGDVIEALWTQDNGVNASVVSKISRALDIDSDLDGIGNLEDQDDDNDQVFDVDDAFPLDATESVDTDGDGVGNNADLDDDNDNFTDEEEAIDGTDPLSRFSCRSGCFSFDVDESLQAQPLTDGLLVIRHLFGFSGDALTSGAVASDANRDASEVIASYLTDADTQLDIDGDGESKPLTDGLLLIRYLFGFSGDSLVSGAIGSDAVRNSAEAVEAYIKARVPAD